ncbi:hypothetical protein [Sabulicella rubraurantiaca]|uniref:hypothetical protein n=1 Tax=Sabulicella rubraurantiaca TaxID=2811429 RepID=UPI001A961410|nr:hypothetical protein [Sabulicella rubraurantiaca]
MNKTAVFCTLAALLLAVSAEAQQFPCAGRIAPVSYEVRVVTAGDVVVATGTRYFDVTLRNQDAGRVAFNLSFENFPSDVYPTLNSNNSYTLSAGSTQVSQFARTLNPNFSVYLFMVVHDSSSNGGRPAIRIRNCRRP